MATLDQGSDVALNKRRPRLAVGHSTLAASDLNALMGFYCQVLGFEVTNRGPVGDDGLEIAFLSQDPGAHHQIAMVGGASTAPADFVMVDHLAFRTPTLDDLRIIHKNLLEGGVEKILQIDHGNAWSLYFNDPEGNGVECYVDSPYHVAQPNAGEFDINAPDEQIAEVTRQRIADAPEFQLMDDWQRNFAKRLETR